MNLLFSCVGRRGYIAEYFREAADGDVQIFGTSSTPWTPGFATCDRTFIVPPYKNVGYESAMLSICEENNVNALFSFMDEDVAKLSSFREKLLAIATVPVLPPQRIADLCLDKWLAYQFFKEKGIKTAASFIDLPSCESALASGEVSFPLFVKPRCGFGSSNSFYVKNFDELRALFFYQEGMMIQEHLHGEWYSADVLTNLDGKLLSVVPWRKLRSRLGETEQAMTVDAPEVITFIENIVNQLDGHVGPMDIDLFVEDGEIFVLEMNPRFGGGYPVTHLAKGDFPRMIIQLLRGEVVFPRIGDYERGVVMMKQLVPFGGVQSKVAKEVLKLSQSLV